MRNFLYVLIMSFLFGVFILFPTKVYAADSVLPASLRFDASHPISFSVWEHGENVARWDYDFSLKSDSGCCYIVPIYYEADDYFRIYVFSDDQSVGKSAYMYREWYVQEKSSADYVLKYQQEIQNFEGDYASQVSFYFRQFAGHSDFDGTSLRYYYSFSGSAYSFDAKAFFAAIASGDLSGFDGKFVKQAPVYNPNSAFPDFDNIGTLQDVNCRRVTNSELDITTYRILFAPLTDKGFQLFDDGHDVEYYFYFSNGKKDYTSVSFLLTDNAHNYVSHRYNNLQAAALFIDESVLSEWMDRGYSEIYPYASSGFGAFYFGVLSKTLDMDTYLYMRPVDKESNTYGKWTRLTFGTDGKVVIDDGVTDRDVPGRMINIDSSKTDSIGNGSGSSWGAADHDSDSKAESVNNGTSVSGNVISATQSLISMVKELPGFIAVLFSFLPSWCLMFVGACFCLFIALIVLKAVL